LVNPTPSRSRQTQSDTKPLWQHGFDWLDSAINVGLPHPLDVDRMRMLVKGLQLVGERPSSAEVKIYLAELWPQFPSTQQRVREIWQTARRYPHRQPRARRLSEPLYVVDLLIEDHALQPVTEDRLEAQAHAAFAEYLDAARSPDQERYAEARRVLDRTVDAIHRLRRLRFGPAALGEWYPEEIVSGSAKRPRWW